MSKLSRKRCRVEKTGDQCSRKIEHSGKCRFSGSTAENPLALLPDINDDKYCFCGHVHLKGTPHKSFGIPR